MGGSVGPFVVSGVTIVPVGDGTVSDGKEGSSVVLGFGLVKSVK